MSECLACGDCCKRMSPLSTDTCPHLVEQSGVYSCSSYEKRPEQCINHTFHGARFCPVGTSVLGITTRDAMSQRIDMLYALRKHTTRWIKTGELDHRGEP
jgi:hypothetical protein